MSAAKQTLPLVYHAFDRVSGQKIGTFVSVIEASEAARVRGVQFLGIETQETTREGWEAIAAAAGSSKYNTRRIAWELERTALGDGYFGNALRVAKDLPGLTADDRGLLDRWAAGNQGGTDHVALQDLALRIDRAGDEPPPEAGDSAGARRPFSTPATPGPWGELVQFHAFRIGIEYPEGDHRDHYMAVVECGDPDELETNARLMRAAPVLRARLREAADLLDSVAFVSFEGDTDALLAGIREALYEAGSFPINDIT